MILTIKALVESGGMKGWTFATFVLNSAILSALFPKT